MSGTDRTHVLLVEDSEIDIARAEKAFSKHALESRLSVVNSGAEALAFLRGEEGLRLREHPLFVLLDLIMPEMNGFDFLSAIREDSSLHALQIIVTTGLEEKHDIDRAFDLGAKGYLVKPVNYEHFIEALARGDFDRRVRPGD